MRPPASGPAIPLPPPPPKPNPANNGTSTNAKMAEQQQQVDEVRASILSLFCTVLCYVTYYAIFILLLRIRARHK
jgi:hypothetical protein